MPFYATFYHLIWTTKYRQPLITPTLEPFIFTLIAEKSATLNCKIHAINAMPDHIHVAVTIPPSLSVSKWAKHVKGNSSYLINKRYPNSDENFRWQNTFGVLTLGKKALPGVIAYINNQKKHHAENTTIEYLERTED